MTYEQLHGKSSDWYNRVRRRPIAPYRAWYRPLSMLSGELPPDWHAIVRVTVILYAIGRDIAYKPRYVLLGELHSIWHNIGCYG